MGNNNVLKGETKIIVKNTILDKTDYNHIGEVEEKPMTNVPYSKR